MAVRGRGARLRVDPYDILEDFVNYVRVRQPDLDYTMPVRLVLDQYQRQGRSPVDTYNIMIERFGDYNHRLIGEAFDRILWPAIKRGLLPKLIPPPRSKYAAPIIVGKCVSCGKKAPLLVCGHCFSASYCGTDCQRKDWYTKHKKLCKKK